MFDEELKAQLRGVHAYVLTIYQRDDMCALDLDGFAGNMAWALDRGVAIPSFLIAVRLSKRFRLRYVTT